VSCRQSHTGQSIISGISDTALIAGALWHILFHRHSLVNSVLWIATVALVAFSRCNFDVIAQRQQFQGANCHTIPLW